MAPKFPVDPWRVRELELDRMDRTESLFALSYGHIGVRGNLDEGDPAGLAGTYLTSFFESHRLAYAEKGYGFPESGQSLVNATNGKVIRLLVDDEPFDVRTGELIRHERILDLRAGTLRREVDWTSPAGQPVRIISTRLVCFSQRAVMAIRYEVEAVERPTRIALQSELVANEPLPQMAEDPGADDAMRVPLRPEAWTGDGVRACLTHRTAESGMRVAAAFDHVLAGDLDVRTELSLDEDQARLTVRVDLEPGQRLTLVKQADLVLALHWCGDRFSLAEKAAAFRYYEGITVRDSSLSATTQAVIAAEVGHLDLAHAYAREAAMIDPQDRDDDTEDGPPHGLAGRGLDRPGLRVRRVARPPRSVARGGGRPVAVRPAAARRDRAAGLRGVLAALACAWRSWTTASSTGSRVTNKWRSFITARG